MKVGHRYYSNYRNVLKRVKVWCKTGLKNYLVLKTRIYFEKRTLLIKRVGNSEFYLQLQAQRG
jgi:hypothetical protein